MNPDDFVKQYYQVFDTDRSQLTPLYRTDSMLTFENTKHSGVEKIKEKLMELPFQRVRHQVTTTDVHTAGNCSIILVTGLLAVDEGDRPMPFTQLFTLAPSPETPELPFFILNDIFRLNLS